MTQFQNGERFTIFVDQMGKLLAQANGDENLILNEGARHLKDLVAVDDWLAPALARGSTESYQQYLIHRDPEDRFCVVSFVWGPGQETPIHDHLVWGIVGQLRGSEQAIVYDRTEGGMVATFDGILRTGEVISVSPRKGDIHKVSNAESDRDSISIHVYGGNIGEIRRHAFALDGTASTFVSGYSTPTDPSAPSHPQ